MPDVEVSVIIASYNNPNVLEATVRSLISVVEFPSMEIIIVDNASSAGNVNMVEREFPSVRLFRSETNEGFGRACHKGARNAKGRFLLFVNSDILLEANPVPEMIALFDKFSNVGIVACQLWNANGTKQSTYYRFPTLLTRLIHLSGMKNILLRLFPGLRYREGEYLNVDYVSGAFLMIPREHYFEIGGFDERYFMYHEDADLCFQSSKVGRKTMVLAKKHVVHLNKHHERITDPFVYLHMNRGLIIFFGKNYGRTSLLCLSFLSILFLVPRWTYLKITNRTDIEIDALRSALREYVGVFGQ